MCDRAYGGVITSEVIQRLSDNVAINAAPSPGMLAQSTG